MAEGSRIGHGTVIKGVEEVVLERNAEIGRLNWITGEPLSSSSFQSCKRNPRLLLKEESAITNRHLIDCTDEVKVGAYSIVAGFRSQILTHSIHFKTSTQDCHPIEIGCYSFIGTGSILLGGAKLPDYSILAAGGVLSHSYEETHQLYGGVPAKQIKRLDPDLKYFHRTSGYVN